MPTATISYNLPEETEEFKLAVHAQEWHMIVWEMDQWLRQKTRYEELPNEVHDAYEKCRERLHDLVAEEGLKL